MKEEFSLEEVLNKKLIKELNSLFDEWNIGKPLRAKNKIELIGMFIEKAREKDSIEYIFNHVSPDQQLLITLVSSMGGRADVDLMHRYDLWEHEVYHSNNRNNHGHRMVNLDDVCLVFVDTETGEYAIPLEFREGIFNMIKKQCAVDIIVKKDISPVERCDMLNALLRFLCFADINETKINADGRIYKKTMESLSEDIKADVTLNCTENVKPLILANYARFLQNMAERLNLVSRKYNDKQDSQVLVITENAFSFLEKNVPEKQREIFSTLDRYKQKILYDLLKYSSCNKELENSWIPADAFFRKVKADDILNFRENSKNKDNAHLLRANYSPQANSDCIKKFARYGIVELHADYRYTKTDAYETVIDYFRLTEYGIKFLNNIAKTENKTDTVKAVKVLIVHSNFEITVLPDTPQDTFFMLNRMADPVTFDVASTYRLTKETILRAMDKGIDKKTIISFIKEHSKNEIPNNVMYSLNDWLSSRKFVQVKSAVFLETEENLLLPALKHITCAEKITDNIAIIAERDVPYVRKLIKTYAKPFIKFDDRILLHFAASKIKSTGIGFKIAGQNIIIIEEKDLDKTVNVLKKNGIIVENKQSENII